MYKIMLADDEGIVIESLKYIIEKNFAGSCEIEYAKTGRSVIELVENFRPDIAVMDIQMPGINGIDAMKEIRKISPATLMIVVSAYDKFDYAREAINLGVLDYLNKPIQKSDIVAALKKAMNIIDQNKEKRNRDLRIREKMENVIPVIESGFIYAVLFQEDYSDGVENYKTLLGIEEDGGYMIVIESGDRQDGEHLTNTVGTGVKIQGHYMEIREIIKGHIRCVAGPVMANKIILFVPHKNEEIDYNTRIHIIDNARNIACELKEKTDIEFRIGIGSVKPVSKLGSSYREALRSLKVTKERVAHVKDLPIGCGYDADYPVEMEKTLFEAVEKGDVNHAIEGAQNYFAWMIDKNAANTPGVKLKTIEFVLWAEHIAYMNGGMTYHFDSPRNEYLTSIMNFEDYDKLGKWFVEKIGEAARNVSTKQDEQSSSLISKAKNYIDTHFHDDLSLDDVSRAVDISPYYFSKLFKEETGVNFIEYLTSVRIQEAKRLLLDGERSIKDICIEIGYQDPNYFSRIFKKHTGVTPTEFKEGKTG